MITFQGLMVRYTLTAASVDERDAVWDLTDAMYCIPDIWEA
jgi:hypothetical protein